MNLPGILAIALATSLPLHASAQVVTFPAPSDPAVPHSPRYQVEVDGRSAFCYATYRHGRPTVDTERLYNRLVNPIDFAIFDFTGSVEIDLTVEPGLVADPADAVVRPLAANIKPRFEGNTVSFVLPKPGNYIFDPRGTGDRVCCLFTNRPEDNVPEPADPKVRYLGPGVHRTGQIIKNPDVVIDAHAAEDFADITFDNVVINGKPLGPNGITVRNAEVTGIALRSQ